MDVKVLEAAKAESVVKTATFAGGCFWGLELAFQRAKGVVSTKVRRAPCWRTEIILPKAESCSETAL